jgi:hypothetical protein
MRRKATTGRIETYDLQAGTRTYLYFLGAVAAALHASIRTVATPCSAA